MLSEDFVASYFEAWNQRDIGGIAGHLAQEGTYYDMGVQEILSRELLIARLEDFFLRDNHIYELVGEVLTAKNSIAFQYRSCPREGFEGSEWMGAEFFTMEGDTAGKIEDYYQDPESPGQGKDGKAGSSTVAVQRYAKSGLDPARLRAVMQKLTAVMKSEKIHLRPDLTLPQLAEKLDCSVNHLSQAINAGFGVGFFDFINQYRVKEATELLCKEGAQSPAILNIALAVGFNSTSTFYAAFKKITGQTPAQYRRSEMQKP